MNEKIRIKAVKEGRDSQWVVDLILLPTDLLVKELKDNLTYPTRGFDNLKKTKIIKFAASSSSSITQAALF